MLETLREYAADRLAADSTERNDVRRRHADWFRALAERSEDLRTDPRRDAILAALERELPNLRSAIASAREDGDVVTAVRIAVALREFWNLRNHLTEGRRILVELQAEAANLDPRLATRLVLTSAELASWQMDRDEAIRLSDLGLAMADTTGDRRLLAIAEQGAAWANVAIDPELARDRFVAAARLARELDEGRVLQGALQGLAIVLMRLGDTDAARSAIDESIAIAEANGDRFQTAMNVISRGFLAARTGDRPGSLRDFERAIRECQTVGAAIGITIALDAFAVDALQHGEPIRAATLAAGAQRLRTELGGGPSVSFVGLPDPLEAAKATVTPEVYDRASAAGRGMSTDDLVAMALSGMLT
jgi:non-specific serine/threonine protein kinase